MAFKLYYMGMAKLGKQDIKRVAELANLSLKESEITKFQEQLSEVISYIEELNEVDTKNVEPTSQTTGLINIKREDKIDLSRNLLEEDALSGTDKTLNGYFEVPGILENKDE